MLKRLLRRRREVSVDVCTIGVFWEGEGIIARVAAIRSHKVVGHRLGCGGRYVFVYLYALRAVREERLLAAFTQRVRVLLAILAHLLGVTLRIWVHHTRIDVVGRTAVRFGVLVIDFVCAEKVLLASSSSKFVQPEGTVVAIQAFS